MQLDEFAWTPPFRGGGALLDSEPPETFKDGEPAVHIVLCAEECPSIAVNLAYRLPIGNGVLIDLVCEGMSGLEVFLEHAGIHLAGMRFEKVTPACRQLGTIEAYVVTGCLATDGLDQMKDEREAWHERAVFGEVGLKRG